MVICCYCNRTYYSVMFPGAVDEYVRDYLGCCSSNCFKEISNLEKIRENIKKRNMKYKIPIYSSKR